MRLRQAAQNDCFTGTLPHIVAVATRAECYLSISGPLTKAAGWLTQCHSISGGDRVCLCR